MDDVHGQSLPLRPGLVEHAGRLYQRVAAKTRRGGPGRPTASSWSTRIWKWPAASPNTSSCWPRSTTSSRTGTPARRTAPTCAGSSREGRVEVMGGTYNEPNTNLTSPETTIRNLVHGIGFQRDVLGADPATAWQLDVFGHDPQFPGMAADAGLTSSSWARGPHHQWGPAQGGDVDRMQFCSEFEWIAPSGRGLLTHYMPAHYSAGWWMDSSTTLAEAEDATYALVRSAQEGRLDAQRAAARRDRLHPAEQVGHRDPPRLGRALHVAAIRVRVAAGVFRGGARRTGAARICAFAADPRHEPDLHRQGRVLHRHQAGQPGRRERRAGGRALRRVRRAADRRRVPAGRLGQGVGAAGLRGAPRRHHRLGVRPGLPRPADRLARRVGAGPRGPGRLVGVAVRVVRRPRRPRHSRAFGRGLEPAGAPAHRHRHRAARPAAWRRRAGA